MERLDKVNQAGLFLRIRCLEPPKYMERYFLLSAAPVLMGVKPSALICFRHCCKDAWRDQEKHVFERTGLCVKELYQNKKTFGLLVYDEALLNERLKIAEAKKLLCRYGYKGESNLSELLEHLKGRFDGAQFPHEIGVFLGYPPEDVDAFIRNRGKDYLCCRYWKVYHDEQNARKTFGFIDQARGCAIDLITRQTPVWEAAKILAGTQTG
ncbi:MAG: DUF3793 family protein [Bacillota bacterium]